MPLNQDPDRVRIARGASPVVVLVFLFAAIAALFADDLTSVQLVVVEIIAIAGAVFFSFMWYITNRNLKRRNGN